jgi:hypothetical protein
MVTTRLRLRPNDSRKPLLLKTRSRNQCSLPDLASTSLAGTNFKPAKSRKNGRGAGVRSKLLLFWCFLTLRSCSETGRGACRCNRMSRGPALSLCHPRAHRFARRRTQSGETVSVCLCFLAAWRSFRASGHLTLHHVRRALHPKRVAVIRQ